MNNDLMFAVAIGFIAGCLFTCLIVKIVDMTHKEHFRRLRTPKE